MSRQPATPAAILDGIGLRLLLCGSLPADNQSFETEHIRDVVSGHWGAVPGLNRLLLSVSGALDATQARPLIVGTGHGIAAFAAWSWSSGALADDGYLPTQKGLGQLIEDFGTTELFPGEISPATPGAMWSGGALGFSLAVGVGMGMAGTSPLVLIGDGEFEHEGTLSALVAATRLPAEQRPTLLINDNSLKMSGASTLAGIPSAKREGFFGALGWRTTEITDADPEQVREAVLAPEPAVVILRTVKGLGVPSWGGEDLVGSTRIHKLPLPRRLSDTDKAWCVEWLRSTPSELGFAETMLGRQARAIFDRCRRDPRLSQSTTLQTPRSTPGTGTPQLTWGNVIAGRIRAAHAVGQPVIVTSPDELESNRLGELCEAPCAIFEPLSESACAGVAVGAAMAGAQAWISSYIGFSHLLAGPLVEFLRAQRHGGEPIGGQLYLALTSLGWRNVPSHRDDLGLLALLAHPQPHARLVLPATPADLQRELATDGEMHVVIYDKHGPARVDGVERRLPGSGEACLLVLGNSLITVAISLRDQLDKPDVPVLAPTSLPLAHAVGNFDEPQRVAIVSSFSMAVTEVIARRVIGLRNYEVLIALPDTSAPLPDSPELVAVTEDLIQHAKWTLRGK